MRAVRVLLVAHVSQASISGLVRDAESGRPLPGAVVALIDLSRWTVTDTGGRYNLDGVPAGPHHITIRFIGYAPRSLHALVPGEGRLEINIALQAEPVQLRPITAHVPVPPAGRSPADEAGPFDRHVSIAEIRNHPTLAEPDAFLVLGGGHVVVRAESPGGLHIRGGATDQTAYLLDGVPVLSPYHAAGLFSAWNPDALSAVRVSSILASPVTPHVLSGAVEGVTLNPGATLRSQGTLSTTQARVTFDGPLGNGPAFLVSARASFPGVIAPANERTYLQGETQDLLAKIEASGAGGRFRLLAYGSGNEIHAASDATAADTGGVGVPANVFDWQSRSIGLAWWRDVAQATLRFLGWHAAAEAVSLWGIGAERVSLKATRRDAGGIALLERGGSRTMDHFGVRIETSSARYDVDSSASGGSIAALQSHTPVATAFAQRNVLGGSRGDWIIGASLAIARSRVFGDYRTQVRWWPSRRASLIAAVATSHQFAQSLRNAESVVGNIFPADLHMGDHSAAFPAGRTRLAVLAAEFRVVAGLAARIEAHHRISGGLVLVAPRTGQPFSMGAYAVGSGTSTGIVVGLEGGDARYTVTARYGLQRVRLHYADTTYVPEHGATLLGEAGLILFPSPTASIRLGTSTAFWRRATPLSGGFEWEACNLIDRGCEFAGSPSHTAPPLGTTRLPPYVRVDLGFRKHWHVPVGSRDAMMTLFGTATNVLGRRNILTYANDVITGQPVAVEMRPFAPLVFGVDWRF